MRRFSLHLTCFVIGFALCAVPCVDAGERANTKVTLSKHAPERPHLGLPAPHAQVHATAPQVFVTPGFTFEPLLTSARVLLPRGREEAESSIWWRARAHPAQAPPA